MNVKTLLNLLNSIIYLFRNSIDIIEFNILFVQSVYIHGF